jgi:hypothetical protein
LTDAASGTPAVNSTIKEAEGFINSVGAEGTGFPLIPRDGLFDEQIEEAYADIPFATINALPVGAHTIYIRGMDHSGNWGAVTSTDIAILAETPLINGTADSYETGSYEELSVGAQEIVKKLPNAGDNGSRQNLILEYFIVVSKGKVYIMY